VTLASAGAAAPASKGSYDVVASAAAAGAHTDLGNYAITYAKGTLTINAAPLTITAADKTKVYGDANPTLTGTITGIKNNDGITATYLTSANATTSVGGYPITATPSDASSPKLSNYTVTLVPGTLTITQAPLTITADNKTKTLNAANPALTGSIVGIKNSDPITATYSTTAVTGSPVGSYPITPSVNPLLVSNYRVTINNGSLTVLYGWNGFLQPVNDTAHQIGVYESKFKLGQTIPMKFDLTDANGATVTQTVNPGFRVSGNLGACDSTAALDTVPTVVPDGAAVYTLTGGHYQYNWSTKSVTTSGEYRVFAQLADGTNQSVFICLTK
jgi:hypothetical protein